MLKLLLALFNKPFILFGTYFGAFSIILHMCIMKNLYLYIFLSFFCFSKASYSQNLNHYNDSEEVSIYPNPVINGKIYITSKFNSKKGIEIFDVLGKKIHASILIGKELNISNLTPGIYIIKITERNLTITRKLVVK